MKFPPVLEASVPASAKVLFFSDAHLGSDESPGSLEKVEQVLGFLEYARTEADVLVILGDLFDFYFEYKTVLPAHHIRVLTALGSLTRDGVACYYTAGNHDFWLGPQFSRWFGVTVAPDALILKREGSEQGAVLAAHGDGMGPGDLGYKLLKKALRNRLLIWLFRQVHPDWGVAIARLVSRLSREYTPGCWGSRTGAQERLAGDLLALDHGLGAVVLAHTHQPADRHLERGRYLNAGDWCKHFSYVSWTPEGFDLKRFKPGE